MSNYCGNDLLCGGAGTVTVIDPISYNTTAVNVGVSPGGIAIDSTIDKIYVANSCGNDLNCDSAGTITAIDGVTKSTITIAVGDYPATAAVDETTNRISRSNTLDGTVSVIGGNTTLQFVNVAPCRLVDTRTLGNPIPGDSYPEFHVTSAF